MWSHVIKMVWEKFSYQICMTLGKSVYLDIETSKIQGIYISRKSASVAPPPSYKAKSETLVFWVWSNKEATQDHEILSEDTLIHDNSSVFALARTSQ